MSDATVEILIPNTQTVEILGPAAVFTDITGGGGGGDAPGNYQHTQAAPATVWVIDHYLGFDPAGITVVDDDGYVLDGYAVQYATPTETIVLTFDISVAGVAYVS